MYPEDQIADLRSRFKLVCKKCGSEEIAIDIERSRHYDSCTVEGGITIGCNACKQNDFVMDI